MHVEGHASRAAAPDAAPQGRRVAPPTQVPLDPALRAPAGAPVAVVQSLSHVIGNRQVARLLAQGENGPTAQHAQQTAVGSDVDAHVREIYDSLDWLNDVPRAMRALQAAHPVRQTVEAAFRDAHGSIWRYLDDQLDVAEAVDAYATFRHGHTHDLHVALARAILPAGTRDAEIHRILRSVRAGERARLAEQYRHDYGDLGEGTLRDDLVDDQSGWELEMSLALLDHDLTDAEQLYFDSLAIVGTHTQSVVSRLQRLAGSSDPHALRNLESQWSGYVSGTSGWGTAPPAAFTDMNLRDAVASELSGEDAALALAAIDHGLRRGDTAGGAPAGATLSEQQIVADERIRLEMNEAFIHAAAAGAGTNEEQIFDSVAAVEAIWTGRIARAEAAGDPATATGYRQEWAATQDRIRPVVADEMDEDGVENLRVRLLLAGPLTCADRLYLAMTDRDTPAAVQVVTEAWAGGEVDALGRQAAEKRVDGGGRVVRPPFEPIRSVPVTSGLPFRKLAVLLNSSWSDAERGAHRLKLDLDEGTADADCRRAVEFLRTPGLSAERRAGVIGAFAAVQGISVTQGGKPEHAFSEWLAERYDRSSSTWAMRDLVDPTTNPHELLARARGRHEAAHSGLLDHVVTAVVKDWDRVTGEDTVGVEQEALRRLEFVATSDASSHELDELRRLTGTGSTAELASLQYGEYSTRLDELRALKASIADGLATAVEVLAAAALTVATAGAAGGALVVTLGSAVAGMVAREAMQGTEYELFSGDNAKQLLAGAVTAGVGTYVDSAVRGLAAIERLGAARAIVSAALVDGSRSVTSESLSAVMSDHVPTVERVAAAALRVLGGSLGGGANSHLGQGLDGIGSRALASVRANIASSMVGGVAQHTGSLLGGTGDLTAVEIGAALAHTMARAVADGTVSGLAEVGAAARQARTRGSDTGDGGSPATGTRSTDPVAAGAEALDAAHAAGSSTASPPVLHGSGGGGRRPPHGGQGSAGGGDGGGGRDRLFGLTDAEFDAAFGHAFDARSLDGPLDAQPAPGRSEKAELVGEMDRTRPMGVSGFAGSTASTPRFGAFEHTVRTERGDELPAVVKVLPVDAADVFEREVAGARAAAAAGLGPPFYGVVVARLDDPGAGSGVAGGLAFAMGRVPGGFTENFSLDRPGTPAHAQAEAETRAAVTALTEQGPRDVRNFGAALRHLGFYCMGDLQGLVGPDGRWRPIDFSAVEALSDDPERREAQLAAHDQAVKSEADLLEKILTDR